MCFTSTLKLSSKCNYHPIVVVVGALRAFALAYKGGSKIRSGPTM